MFILTLKKWKYSGFFICMGHSVRIFSSFLNKSGNSRTIFILGGKSNTPSKKTLGNYGKMFGQVGGGDCHLQILPTLAVSWHFSSTPLWWRLYMLFQQQNLCQDHEGSADSRKSCKRSKNVVICLDVRTAEGKSSTPRPSSHGMWWVWASVKSPCSALAGVAQWIECGPANRRVAGLIPSQGTRLGCGPGP